MEFTMELTEEQVNEIISARNKSMLSRNDIEAMIDEEVRKAIMRMIEARLCKAKAGIAKNEIELEYLEEQTNKGVFLGRGGNSSKARLKYCKNSKDGEVKAYNYLIKDIDHYFAVRENDRNRHYR